MVERPADTVAVSVDDQNLDAAQVPLPDSRPSSTSSDRPPQFDRTQEFSRTFLSDPQNETIVNSVCNSGDSRDDTVLIQRRDSVHRKAGERLRRRRSSSVKFDESKNTYEDAVSMGGVSTQSDDEDEANMPKSGTLDVSSRKVTLRQLHRFRRVIMEPKGTLIVDVGDESLSNRRRELVVLSSTAKRLGPEWENMASMSPREKLWGGKRIRLPEDDADMMFVIMAIVHTNFRLVPEKLDWTQLIGMTRLCVRYGLNAKIKPYLARWLAPHKANYMKPHREQWLLVAHQFGLKGDYMRLSKHLAMNCRTQRQGELLVPGTREVLTGTFPEFTLSDIRYIRIFTLNRLLHSMYTLIDNLEKGNVCTLRHRETTAEDGERNGQRSLCSNHNKGTLTRDLAKESLWPPVAPVKVSMSVQELVDYLCGLPPVRLPGMPSHDGCDITLVVMRCVGEVLENIPKVARPEVLEGLARNGAT